MLFSLNGILLYSPCPLLTLPAAYLTFTWISAKLLLPPGSPLCPLQRGQVPYYRLLEHHALLLYFSFYSCSSTFGVLYMFIHIGLGSVFLSGI